MFTFTIDKFVRKKKSYLHLQRSFRSTYIHTNKSGQFVQSLYPTLMRIADYPPDYSDMDKRVFPIFFSLFFLPSVQQQYVPTHNGQQEALCSLYMDRLTI